MTRRITWKMVSNETFPTLIRVAQGAGLDTSEWRLGSFYSSFVYHLETKRDSSSSLGSWTKPREAYDAMHTMIGVFHLMALEGSH
jgi:hypothetical protein